MSVQGNGTDLGTLVAAADLSGKQHHFVVVDANGKVALAGAGAVALGVLQNKPKAGEACTVRIAGVTKLVASAAIAAGAKVAATAAGQGVTAGASTDFNGLALGAAAAANEVISVLLKDGKTSA